jgi:hypothetical protein
MIARLILRDRALRLLPPWLLLGVLTGFALSSMQQDAVRHGLTVGLHGYQGFRYSAYLPWGLISLYLFFAGVTSRCSRLDMTLPYPHRTLWLSRVLALGLAALVLVAVAAVTLMVRNWVDGFHVVGRTRVESLFAQLAAVSILAVILIHLPRPALHQLPFKATSVVYLILVWVGGWGILFVLAGDPPGLALLPLAAAVILGLWSYVSLPGPFKLVPREAERVQGTLGQVPLRRRAKAAAVGDDGAIPDRAGPGWLQFTIWRAFFGHWLSWLLVAMLLALGVAAGRAEPNSSLYTFWLYAFYWLLLSALFGLTLARLPMLDPLPLPRKLLFAHMVLPGLLAALLGCAGAKAIQTGRASDFPLVDYRQHPVVKDWAVQVPLSFWEISWDEQPSPVEEPYVPPWEEPHYPGRVALFDGLPLVLYSPYHTPVDSPPEVVAEQLSRAVEAVYGTRIPPEELQQRYLVEKADGAVGVRPRGVTLREDYPGLEPVARMQTLPVTILLIGLPWLLYLALTVRGGYATADAAARPWGHVLLAGLSLLGVLGSLWAVDAGLTAQWKLVALAGILVRRLAGLLPGHALLQWGVVVALMAGAYLLAQFRFERIEALGTVSSEVQPTMG